jgi:hypothetical protein
MRLKAPEGRGNPVVGGIEIRPNKGVYDVETHVGRHLVDSFGYIDIDAPPKAATPTGTDNAALRDGALAALKHLSVAVPADFADARIAEVLVDAVRDHVAGVPAKVKAAEEALLAALVAKDGSKDTAKDGAKDQAKA